MFDKKKVSISVGGGLGDVLMTYLANPKSHCEDGEGNYPTSNHQGSIWFRRLRDFKEKNPDVEILLINTSHNPVTVEFFETYPYIDRIESFEWTKSHGYRLWSVDDPHHFTGTLTSIPIEEEYNPIHWFHNYNDYETDPEPNLFLTDSEEQMCYDYGVKIGTDFVIGHCWVTPPRDIMPLSKFQDLRELIEEKYEMAFYYVGRDLFPIRVSVWLGLNCKAFVGGHSAMWIVGTYAGWKRGIKTATFIPDIPHFENIKGSAVAWGLEQSFNRTWKFCNFDEVRKFDMAQVADWLLRG